MMMIAPRSSMIASAVRNTLRDGAIRLPNRAITPSEKAISVSQGIAQPVRASGLFRIMAR